MAFLSRFIQIVCLIGTILSNTFCQESANEGCKKHINCFQPECFCPHTGAMGQAPNPGDLSSEETPQVVAFSFDDAVNVQNFDIYNRLFPSTLRNPSDCPISMTLFVSHNFTNYDMVRSLYNRGMEIAVHSVTHRLPASYWKTISKEDMLYEAAMQRSYLSMRAGIPYSKIYGWRSPFLQLGGDMSFEVLQDIGFEYDSSILMPGVSAKAAQQWPFTLDHGFPYECRIPPCPRQSYQGFWEIPVVPLDDMESKFPCTYLDSCFFAPQNRKETLDLLFKNFFSNYNGTRQPVYFNLHASWFYSAPYRIQAMEQFIQTILTYKDVYILGMHEVIEYVRGPRPIEQLCTFEPWLCL